MTRHGGRNQALNNLATGRTIKFELKCHTHAFAYDLPGSDADASSDASSDALQCHVLWLVILLSLLLLLHSAQCEASGKSAVPTVLCLCHSPLFAYLVVVLNSQYNLYILSWLGWPAGPAGYISSWILCNLHGQIATYLCSFAARTKLHCLLSGARINCPKHTHWHTVRILDCNLFRN